MLTNFACRANNLFYKSYTYLHRLILLTETTFSFHSCEVKNLRTCNVWTVQGLKKFIVKRHNSGNHVAIKQKSIILSKVRDLWCFLSGGRARGMNHFVFPWAPNIPFSNDNTLIVLLKNKKEGTQTQAFFIRITPCTEKNRSKMHREKYVNMLNKPVPKGMELRFFLFAVVTVPLCSGY